ncbi:YqaA family protein [Sphingomonas hengshuiensis]|uniref:Cytochrome B561 n=1 Tax=Sphingomonas hengshuiensis TaxID=1609977 RepID=A0A7U4J8B0_9SPHN|nr:YqaA family protein [Sphingomonas hengshuiensis]AJP72108.1 cytochrome B561 [Sphingomonas hengshuiensis]
MFRALYDWVLRMAHHRHALRTLAVVSFAESSFFPIPPDAMVIPMVIARRDQAFLIAGICTVFSVLGGMFGYAIGYFLLESVGAWVIELYHMQDKIGQFQTMYGEYGAAIILLKGLTPIPFKLVTIASGIAHFNFPLFVLLATITRGFRFFLIAALLKRFGAPVQAFIEERLNLFAWGFLILVVGGFVAVAYL